VIWRCAWPTSFCLALQTGAANLTAGIDGLVGREATLALEPLLHAYPDEAGCAEAWVAIADMIDMRLPSPLAISGP